MEKKRKRKLKLKTIGILIACGTVLLSMIVVAYLFFFAPKVVFKENPTTLEINENYTPKQFVSELKRGTWQDIHVKGKVNNKKLGEYTLTYQLKNHEFQLKVKVQDTIKPKVEVLEQNVDINSSPTADSFIKSTKDATKTQARFKENYIFDTLGEKEIILIIQDEGKNVTEVPVKVQVVPKDTTPPVIQVHDFEIIKGNDFDVLSGVSASDDRDGNLEVNVDTSSLNKDVAGVYTIVYSASDKAGNKTSRNATVRILEPVSDSGKVMYLTIDDGPSPNTPKILEILNRYGVKATFFVTAQYPAYLQYIKEEYNQGHAIGLHTYSHRYEAVYANDAAYFEDLQKISDVVQAQTGMVSHLIRFPGGSSNTISANYNHGIMSRLSKEVSARGYQYYDWNSACGDGNSAIPASTLIATSKQYTRGPMYFLMHDHGGSNATVEALPAMIEYFKGQGYTFEVLSSGVQGYHHNINN